MKVMRELGLVVATSVVLVGCGGGAQAPAKCGAAECKEICGERGPAAATPPPTGQGAPAAGLTAFEQQIVQPMLEDVRQGVRAFGEQTVGICKGQGKECEEWLGTEVADLPPGKYMLRAELRVPKAGDAWKVRLDTSCETTKKTKSGETKNTQSNSKEYEVKYLGEERGYRLSPLFTIDSPSTSGARSCTWKLVLAHPDGDKTIEGKWSVPDAST